MRKIVLVALLIAVSISTFALAHKKTKKKKISNDIVSVKVHRTACFGRCPEYKIEITNTGVATYTAVRFNDDSGIYRKTIGVEKAMDVLDAFKIYRIDTCKEVYDNRIPDIPGIIFTITYKNKSKPQVIHNAHFGPQFLKVLAQQMDEVGKKTDDSWKKISSDPEAVIK